VELRLFDVATPVALALGKPQLLGYDRSALPDDIVEEPGGSSLHQKRRRTGVDGRVRDEESVGPALVTEWPDEGWIQLEEIRQIHFRNLWGKCVGNVAIREEVTVVTLVTLVRVIRL
jgi:hypothetical protein